MSLVSKLVPWVNKTPAHNSRVNVVPDASEAYLAAIRFRNSITRLAFIVLIVIPTALTTVYYGLIAAPRYVSEVHFLVRSVNSQRATGLDAFFRTFGISRTADDSYAIEKYIQSKDFMLKLKERLNLKEIFGRKEADILSRYPAFYEKDNDEHLFRYIQYRINVREDELKGIVIAKVSTFDPADSVAIATELVKLAEGMVNRLNERAQRDTVDSALDDVKRAEERVIQSQADLSAFRSKELLLDPGKSSMTYVELIGTLDIALSQGMAQLQQTQTLSPSSPDIAAQKARLDSISERIKIERAKLVGSDDSLATKLAEFERLSLMRTIADRTLESNMTALENARQEARRQHIYIEQVITPNLPDWPTEPERIRGILTIFVLGFAIFSVVWILSVGVGEHAQ